MSLLNEILKQIQGSVAQVNPFDGGQDYQSVTRPRIQGAVNPQAQIARGGTVYSPGEGPRTQHDAPSAAQRYEAAFSRGDLNSPDIIGVDPAQFGYAEDIGQYGVAPRPQVPNFGAVQGSVNPIWQQRRGNTPYSPGEGPRTRF